jgi:glyoxylase-like metal-dependent hydrolase (beta-lactamase superfamily II)
LCDAWQFEPDGSNLLDIFNAQAMDACKLTSIEHQQDITLGQNVTVTAIYTPGHSRCSMSYLIQPDAILLCSDALGEIVSEHDFLPLIFDNYIDYRSTLDSLSELSPRMIGLGHHGTLYSDLALTAARDARHSLDRLVTELCQAPDARASQVIAGNFTHNHWERSRRFITRKLHQRSMQRMIELIKDNEGDKK